MGLLGVGRATVMFPLQGSVLSADRSCSPAAKGAALEPPPATHLNSDSDDGVENEEGEEGEEVKEVEEVNGIEVKET